MREILPTSSRKEITAGETVQSPRCTERGDKRWWTNERRGHPSAGFSENTTCRGDGCRESEQISPRTRARKMNSQKKLDRMISRDRLVAVKGLSTVAALIALTASAFAASSPVLERAAAGIEMHRKGDAEIRVVRKDGTAVPDLRINVVHAPTIFFGNVFRPRHYDKDNTGHVSWSSLISSSCSNSIGASTNEKKASRNSTSAWETTTRLGCRSRACSTSTSNPNRRGNRLKMRIKEEWTSRQSGTADAAGVYAFRGFFGRYDVRVTAAGSHAVSPRLEKGKPKCVELHVGLIATHFRKWHWAPAPTWNTVPTRPSAVGRIPARAHDPNRPTAKREAYER